MLTSVLLYTLATLLAIYTLVRIFKTKELDTEAALAALAVVVSIILARSADAADAPLPLAPTQMDVPTQTVILPTPPHPPPPTATSVPPATAVPSPTAEMGEPLIDLGVDTLTTCERYWTVGEADVVPSTGFAGDVWKLSNPGKGTLVIEEISFSCEECLKAGVESVMLSPGGSPTQLWARYYPKQDPLGTPGHTQTIAVRSNATNCPFLRVVVISYAN